MSSSRRSKLSFTLDKSKTKPAPPTISPSPLLSKSSISGKATSAVEYIDEHVSTFESKSKQKEPKTRVEEVPDVVFEPLDLNVYGLQERRIKSGSLPKEANGALPAWLTKPKMDPQHALEHDLRRIEELSSTREMKSDHDSTSDEDESGKEINLNTIKTALGWKDGQRVGKPRRVVTEGVIYRDLVTPIQFLPRPELLGLGSKIERGTSSSSRDKDKPRNVIGIDEKMVIKKIAKGSKVTIKEGEHAGLTGIVIYHDRESVEVSLDVSEERVLLPFESCQLLDRIQQNEIEIVEGEHIDEDLGDWLRDGLVVRFVSRSWRGGRYYNKRGIIEDTHRDPQTAITTSTVSLQSDRREILHDVPPSAITPCPPVIGRPVIILRTKHAGSIARLIEQAHTKDWIVQLNDSMELATIASNDLGEFARR